MPHKATIPFFLLIARESVWTPFMVSVNTEDGWLYFGKRIFAIPISPVAVIVRSDIAKDDDDVRFCELIVIGLGDQSDNFFVISIP